MSYQSDPWLLLITPTVSLRTPKAMPLSFTPPQFLHNPWNFDVHVGVTSENPWLRTVASSAVPRCLLNLWSPESSTSWPHAVCSYTHCKYFPKVSWLFFYFIHNIQDPILYFSAIKSNILSLYELCLPVKSFPTPKFLELSSYCPLICFVILFYM